MGKKKIKIEYLLLLLFLFSIIHSHSQGFFTEKLQWYPSNSIVFFQSKDQMIEWSKERLSFAVAYSKEFTIKGHSIFIAIADGCSGIHCLAIGVFKEQDGLWKLVTGTSARLKEKIMVKLEDDAEKIVFGTTSGKVIGTLPFNIFNDD